MRVAFWFAIASAGFSTSLGAVTYEATISSVESERLAEALAASSALLELQDETPVDFSAEGLIRRAEADLDNLEAALRSEGYYFGDQVEIFIHGQPLGSPTLLELLEALPTDARVAVQINVEPGPRYRFTQLDVVGDLDTGAPPPLPVDLTELPIQIGQPARAALVIASETTLINQMRQQGHPFAAAPRRRAIVDHQAEAMEVTFELQSGPFATLDGVSFNGLDRTRESFLLGRVPWEWGEVYRPERIDELRANLTELDIFSSVRVTPSDHLNAAGELPVVVTVEERPPRFIGLGAAYHTSEGASVFAYWGHRNLFGAAERLRLDFEVAGIGEGDYRDYTYRAALAFTKPDFFVRDQTLRLEASAQREVFEAYTRAGVRAFAGVDRVLTERVTGGLGLTFDASEIEEPDGQTDRFFLYGPRAHLHYDGTDNALDPTEGIRAGLTFTAFPEFIGSTRDLYIARADASWYQDFGSEGAFVLAFRGALGGLAGEPRDRVPADRRFYAGGGGSVRGYDFQSIGPLDDDDRPIGGRSMVEGSLELRWRVTDTIGLVPFVDAGGVFESSFPDFDEDIQYGAGLGLRYYTGFGPVRVDVATPINPRERDGDYAIYVSLGQAF